ncbi:MAG: hypothetical protein ACLPID_14325 [Beijerinckiaceae bacterium]
MRLRIGPNMSTPEAPIPKKFWAMVGWTVQNHPWIFFLVAIERMAEHDFRLAAVFAAIFVANLFVASRWDEFGGYLQRRKRMLPYLAIGAIGLLLVGIAVGALWNDGISSGNLGRANTGRLIWNFDDPAKLNTDFFLIMASMTSNMAGATSNDIRVGGVQAIGKNTSGDPVSQFKGFVRVDRTNKTEIFYLIAGEADSSKMRTPFDLNIPTLPEETYGIPGLANFKIQTFEKIAFEPGKDGVPVAQFLKDFVPFTLVLEYDGLKIERHFSKQMIEDELVRFERFSNPANSALIPRIVRKPNASPPKVPHDFPPLFQQPDQVKGPPNGNSN